MTRLVGEAMNFVFDTRAIARPNTLDHPRKHGASIQTGAHNFMRPLIGVRDPAWHLPWVHGAIAHEAEDGRRIIARLYAEL